MQASIEKQREANKRRLEERRRKRDEKQYEEDYALSIISSADRSFHMMQEKSSQQKAKQHDSVWLSYVFIGIVMQFMTTTGAVLSYLLCSF